MSRALAKICCEAPVDTEPAHYLRGGHTESPGPDTVGSDYMLFFLQYLLLPVYYLMHPPSAECEGYEADDILGTLAKACGDAGNDCVIATGDRDSLLPFR